MGQLSPILRHGTNFLSWRCPGCNRAHSVKTGVGGWGWNGDAEKPTFTPSVLVRYDGADADETDAPPAICHSFVENGRMRFLDDCTHALRGKTVAIPPWRERAGE